MSEEIKLFVQYQPEAEETQREAPAWPDGADGLVINPCGCTPERLGNLAFETALLLGGDPGRDVEWCEDGERGRWICDQGLELPPGCGSVGPTCTGCPDSLSSSRKPVIDSPGLRSVKGSPSTCQIRRQYRVGG